MASLSSFDHRQRRCWRRIGGRRAVPTHGAPLASLTWWLPMGRRGPARRRLADSWWAPTNPVRHHLEGIKLAHRSLRGRTNSRCDFMETVELQCLAECRMESFSPSDSHRIGSANGLHSHSSHHHAVGDHIPVETAFPRFSWKKADGSDGAPVVVEVSSSVKNPIHSAPATNAGGDSAVRELQNVNWAGERDPEMVLVEQQGMLWDPLRMQLSQACSCDRPLLPRIV